MTPGDRPDVLVAMNPAALKANLGDLPRGADIIVNTDEFTKRNLAKVGYAANPLDDGSLDAYSVHPVGLTSMTVEALKDFDISQEGRRAGQEHVRPRAAVLALPPPTEGTVAFLEHEVRQATSRSWRPTSPPSRRAGTSARPPRTSRSPTRSSRPRSRPGTYRNISGNLALAYGLVAASQRSGLPLFLGSYPITPASDILHELSKHKRFGVRTFQAEDEIAAVGAALGAAFGGSLAVTTTSGPGLALKAETIGLGVSPRAAADHRRRAARPARRPGMPTKTEQADLLQAMFGRNGESPVPIVAPRSPADCFDAAIEAARIATKYRTPVILLSDGYLANGSEPWRDPGGRRPARPARRLRHRAQQDPRRRQHGVLALPARPRDPGPAVGGARHRRPRAPHRRHREGRRHRQHLLRPGQPRPHGAHPAGQGRRHRGDDPAARGRRPERAGAGAGARLGLHLRPDRRGLPRRARDTASRSRRPTCATSTRSRPTLGEVLQRLRQGADARDEPRPAGAAGPRRGSSSTPSATTRCAGCRSRPTSSPR